MTIDIADIAARALQWAQENYATASVYHRAAFANSVSYLVNGFSGGYGGPSLREHLVSWSLGQVGAAALPDGTAITTVTQSQLPYPGEWDFEAACEYCAPLCFCHPAEAGNVLLQIWEREYCFDDDPLDVAWVTRGFCHG